MLFCRLAGLALGVGLFYAVSWMPLRIAVRDAAASCLQTVGMRVDVTAFEGSPALRVAGKQFHFTPDCTYIDLVLILIPFLWRVEASPGRNLVCLAAFTAVVQLVNLVRAWFSIWFSSHGGSWFLAHDLPDYLLYYPTLVIVILWALRRDRQWADQPTTSAALAPATE